MNQKLLDDVISNALALREEFRSGNKTIEEARTEGYFLNVVLKSIQLKIQDTVVANSLANKTAYLLTAKSNNN